MRHKPASWLQARATSRIAAPGRGQTVRLWRKSRILAQDLDIIGVIDDIARQTNLLCLTRWKRPALAKPARFRGVASEVRSLAQRSSQAAKRHQGADHQTATQVQGRVDLVNEAGQSLTSRRTIKKVTPW